VPGLRKHQHAQVRRSCLSPDPRQPFRSVLWGQLNLAVCYDGTAGTNRHLKPDKRIAIVAELKV
jgi:hypothetical protein